MGEICMETGMEENRNMPTIVTTNITTRKYRHRLVNPRRTVIIFFFIISKCDINYGQTVLRSRLNDGFPFCGPENKSSDFKY